MCSSTTTISRESMINRTKHRTVHLERASSLERWMKAQILPSFSASNALVRSSNSPSSTSRRLASSSLFRWAIGHCQQQPFLFWL